jgi:arylformamidase
MAVIYRGMDRQTLDAAYNNTQAIPNFPEMLADFQARSASLYDEVACRRDLRYGSGARERYDWFPCARADAPTFVFIHGGYWQNCTKEDFAFVARGPLSRGFNVVLAEYTLAPEASMTRIVGEIGGLLDHLQADRDDLGIAQQALCLSGHSAGGQLTALHRSHRAVTAALAISPLVDLEPISLSWLNEKLKLSRDEIDRYSPIKHIGKGAPTVVAVGASELRELIRHTDDYAEACERVGEKIAKIHVHGCTHFSVLEDLAQPDGVLPGALDRLMSGTPRREHEKQP